MLSLVRPQTQTVIAQAKKQPVSLFSSAKDINV
jgi:hypothetical protein